MQAVADAAGVTKPVVYECYPNKDELLLTLLDREEQRLMKAIFKSLPSNFVSEDRRRVGDLRGPFPRPWHPPDLRELRSGRSARPPEVAKRIVEPFFTTKPVGQGTGVGLDVSWRVVVNRHHGDLQVRSQPGDTRFQVRLPLHEE